MATPPLLGRWLDTGLFTSAPSILRKDEHDLAKSQIKFLRVHARKSSHCYLGKPRAGREVFKTLAFFSYGAATCVNLRSQLSEFTQTACIRESWCCEYRKFHLRGDYLGNGQAH
jgi:hypothetical protein